MPEIAEVETVRNVLKGKVLHKKIINAIVRYKNILEVDEDYFKKIVIGQEIRDIARKGKWLLFDLGDYYLLSHLRMEGKYYIKDSSEAYNKHEHIIFCFADHTDLRYHDTRKFGRMNLVKKSEIANAPELVKLGYDPDDSRLTKEYLYNSFKGRKTPLKTTLLDQSIISGLGNIYVDEVLFRSHLNPLRIPSSLSLEDCENIITASREIVKKAIEEGGTTIKSYTSSLGVTGNYQNFLCVHKRENCLCKVCNTSIKRIKVGGRSTYFCPNCQK